MGTSKQVDTSTKPMLRLSIKWTMIRARDVSVESHWCDLQVKITFV